MAAIDGVLAKARAIAGQLLQCDPGDLVFGDGAFAGSGHGRTIDLEAVAAAAMDPEPWRPGAAPGLACMVENPLDLVTFPNGCHVAEVEIDPETGVVTLDRYIAIDDFGTVVNPLLTGGQVQGGLAQGIGQAIALAFVREGAKVALVDRNAHVVELAEAWQREQNAQTVGIVADVTDYADMQRAAQQTEQTLGVCAHLIYAAGVGSGKFGFPFTHLQPSDWTRVLEVNVMGMVHVAHALAPRMIAQRAGTMVFVASVAGPIGSQTDPPYSASKAANINFAQC